MYVNRKLQGIVLGALLLAVVYCEDEASKSRRKRCRCKKYMEQMNKDMNDKFEALESKFKKYCSKSAGDLKTYQSNAGYKMERITDEMNKTRDTLSKQSYSLRLLQEDMYSQDVTVGNLKALDAIVKNISVIVESLEATVRNMAAKLRPQNQIEPTGPSPIVSYPQEPDVDRTTTIKPIPICLYSNSGRMFSNNLNVSSSCMFIKKYFKRETFSCVQVVNKSRIVVSTQKDIQILEQEGFFMELEGEATVTLVGEARCFRRGFASSHVQVSDEAECSYVLRAFLTRRKRWVRRRGGKSRSLFRKITANPPPTTTSTHTPSTLIMEMRKEKTTRTPLVTSFEDTTTGIRAKESTTPGPTIVKHSSSMSTTSSTTTPRSIPTLPAATTTESPSTTHYRPTSTIKTTLKITEAPSRTPPRPTSTMTTTLETTEESSTTPTRPTSTVKTTSSITGMLIQTTAVTWPRVPSYAPRFSRHQGNSSSITLYTFC